MNKHEINSRQVYHKTGNPIVTGVVVKNNNLAVTKSFEEKC